MEENTSQDLKSRIISLAKLKIVFISLFCFVIVSLIIYLSYAVSPEKIKEPTANISPSPIKIKEANAKLIPKVYFGKYTNKASLPNVPLVVSSYDFKTNFTQYEVSQFAKKLGIKSVTPTNTNYLLGFEMGDINGRGILTFDKVNGYFTYQSYGVLKSSDYQKGQAPREEALSMLKELGIADETLSCPIIYERKGLENVSFVECHRDWAKSGLPILSFVGILNLSEKSKISSLSLATVDNSFPSDKSIANVLKNGIKDIAAEGKVRPNDFNSITFSVDKDTGNILSIDSRLRWITKKELIQQKDLLTPQEAVQEFENHKANLSLTIPAGFGSFDWNKVYQNNQAIGDNATITDITLSYLEKQGEIVQESLYPEYIIRGTATLSTGYRVRFVETIPALRSKRSLSAINPVTKEVAGEKTDKGGLQIDTFKPNIIIPSTTTPALTDTPDPTPAPITSKCMDFEKGREVTLNVPGYGTLIVVSNIISSFKDDEGKEVYFPTNQTFFIKAASFPVTEMNKIKDAFFKAVEDQYVINVARHVKKYAGDPDLAKIMKVNINEIATVDKAKEFYKLINRNISCNVQTNVFPEVPLYDCKDSLYKESAAADLERQERIANNVAQKTVEMIRNSTYNSLAAKPNLFPDPPKDPELGLSVEMKFKINWLFIDHFSLGEKEFEEFYKSNVARQSNFYSQFAPYKGCYISGVSPYIFLYPLNKEKVSIQLPDSLVFSDPKSNGYRIDVLANPDGYIRQDGMSRAGIYYEYNSAKVLFEEPSDGYVVERDKWEKFVRNDLSKRLGLNFKEIESLVIEINNALFDTPKTKYLKISLIPQSELNEKLPLIINPKPDNIYRINVFVKPMETNLTNWANVSNLIPIRRDGFTVVELGAYSNL